MKSLKHIIDPNVDETSSKTKTNILNHQLMKPTIYLALTELMDIQLIFLAEKAMIECLAVNTYWFLRRNSLHKKFKNVNYDKETCGVGEEYETLNLSSKFDKHTAIIFGEKSINSIFQ